MLDEVIDKAMDEVEKERTIARGTASLNGGSVAVDSGELAKATEVVRIDNAEED